MAQIWLFVAGGVGMTLGTLIALFPDPRSEQARVRHGVALAVTTLGLAIGVAGAFVG